MDGRGALLTLGLTDDDIVTLVELREQTGQTTSQVLRYALRLYQSRVVGTVIVTPAEAPVGNCHDGTP